MTTHISCRKGLWCIVFNIVFFASMAGTIYGYVYTNELKPVENHHRIMKDSKSVTFEIMKITFKKTYQERYSLPPNLVYYPAFDILINETATIPRTVCREVIWNAFDKVVISSYDRCDFVSFPRCVPDVYNIDIDTTHPQLRGITDCSTICKHALLNKDKSFFMHLTKGIINIVNGKPDCRDFIVYSNDIQDSRLTHSTYSTDFPENIGWTLLSLVIIIGYSLLAVLFFEDVYYYLYYNICCKLCCNPRNQPIISPSEALSSPKVSPEQCDTKLRQFSSVAPPPSIQKL